MNTMMESQKPESGKSNEVSGKSKSVPRIKYADESKTDSRLDLSVLLKRRLFYLEQWSPTNPQGKRQYDSNFLLQFQRHPVSLFKPNDLPNIDCVLDEPHNKLATPMQPIEFRPGGSDFIRNFLRGSSPRRGPRRQNPQDSRPVHTPTSGHGSKVNTDSDMKLNATVNAWRPTRQDTNLIVSQDEKETIEITKSIRAIMNELTPSTFKSLRQQVLSLNIDTERKLRGAIDLIFEKAVEEPNFSEAYANMCRQMTTIQVTTEENPDQHTPVGQVEFRKLLLTKCLREFEKNMSDQEHLLELQKRIDTDAELAPQLKEEYETAKCRMCRQMIGNIRFIGELFRVKMLTESIMHNCIMSLFKAKDDDHLESLCCLLTIIGKDLDHVKGKRRMDQYFDHIRKAIQEKTTSARVRFMLQDVGELRSNNWVPHAIQTQGPKTVSQIHQDAKQEQEMLQLKLATLPTAAPMKQGDRRQDHMRSHGHGEDGWTKVSSTPKLTRFDPNRMKLMRQSNIDKSKVTLGPSRGFGGWKSGSAGSGITRTGLSRYSPSGLMDETQKRGGQSNTPTSMMNRFSALSYGAQGFDYDYQRRHGGRHVNWEGTKSGSRGSGLMGPPSTSFSGGHTLRRDERTLLLETTCKLTSNDRTNDSRQKSSRESRSSIPRQPRSATPQQTEPAHKYNADMDEDRMQTKSKDILEEFLNIVDFEEATECLEELNAPPTLMYAMVYIAHEFTLEKKKEARTNIGKLMAHLLKRGRLSVEQYVKGLLELLEMATDLEIDVPKVWEYLAEQLAPVFADDNQAEISISRLGELATPLQEENKSGVFVAEVVKAVICEGSLQSFIARWQQSNLSWSKILLKDADTVRSFLKQHNLEDLADSDSSQQIEGAVPATLSQGKPSKTNEQYCFEIELTKLLDNACTNQEIFEWVDKNLKGEDMTGPAFLRALTISICKRSIATDAAVTVNEDKICERSILLKKYVDTQPERELQVLYALQHLMVDLDQPANVLRKFFDVFYNEDVVQEQSFYMREESKDPNEQEGKGIAIASVNPFFTWLRTADAESD